MPSNYYVITTLSAIMIVPNHKASDFNPVGLGNLVSISDQDPCGVKTLGTTEYGAGNLYTGPSIQAPDSLVIRADYNINSTFLMPTIHVSGGGIYGNWQPSNGTQGFNIRGDVPLPNSC